jgi:hypothetical protein
MTVTDITRHEEWFAAYAAGKIAEAGPDVEPLRLKCEHTRRVLANAREIVRAEHFSPRLARAALLAALYHDVGRFDQYLRHRTFNDRVSCNHAVLGIKIINRQRCLDGEELRPIIGAAVALHNRFILPAALADDLQRITLVVRDADKLDILRLMDEELHGEGKSARAVVYGLPDDPARASDKIIAAALAGRPASYGDLQSVGDFRLLLAAWIFEMNFAASRRRFAVNGHAQRLLAALPPDSPYGPARAKLLAQLDEWSSERE